MDSWKDILDIASYSEIKTIFLLPLPLVYTIYAFFAYVIDIMVGEAGLEPATKAL